MNNINEVEIYSLIKYFKGTIIDNKTPYYVVYSVNETKLVIYRKPNNALGVINTSNLIDVHNNLEAFYLLSKSIKRSISNESEIDVINFPYDLEKTSREELLCYLLPQYISDSNNPMFSIYSGLAKMRLEIFSHPKHQDYLTIDLTNFSKNTINQVIFNTEVYFYENEKPGYSIQKSNDSEDVNIVCSPHLFIDLLIENKDESYMLLHKNIDVQLFQEVEQEMKSLGWRKRKFFLINNIEHDLFTLKYIIRVGSNYNRVYDIETSYIDGVFKMYFKWNRSSVKQIVFQNFLNKLKNSLLELLFGSDFKDTSDYLDHQPSINKIDFNMEQPSFSKDYGYGNLSFTPKYETIEVIIIKLISFLDIGDLISLESYQDFSLKSIDSHLNPF